MLRVGRPRSDTGGSLPSPSRSGHISSKAGLSGDDLSLRADCTEEKGRDSVRHAGGKRPSLLRPVGSCPGASSVPKGRVK